MELFNPERWAATLANTDLLWQGFLVLGPLVFSSTLVDSIAAVLLRAASVGLVVQVFFVYTAGPMLLQAITGAEHVVRIAPFVLVVICVGLYHGAYVAEVIRTGIEAIPRGQMEGAQSQGFTRVQAYRYVILPQTFRIILPPLANQALNLVKNTSVLALIAGGDLMYQADILVADSGYLQGYIVCCAMYFLICFPIAMLVTWLEKRSRAPRKARRAATAGATKAEV